MTTILPDPGIREEMEEGTIDYLPINLSIFLEYLNSLPSLDVALVQLSPPNRYGYCSFGVSGDYTKPAALAAKLVIAEINRDMPRTLGDTFIHVNQVHYFVRSENPILELSDAQATAIERAVAENVARLVPDGSTVQLGVGSMANAVALELQKSVILAFIQEFSPRGSLAIKKTFVAKKSTKNVDFLRIRPIMRSSNPKKSKYVDTVKFPGYDKDSNSSKLTRRLIPRGLNLTNYSSHI